MTNEPRPCSCGKPRAKHYHIACPECWALVPRDLQTRVSTLYRQRPRTVEHLTAVRLCYAAIHKARNS